MNKLRKSGSGFSIIPSPLNYLHYQFSKHDFYIQIEFIDDYENKLEIIFVKKPLFKVKSECFNNPLTC